mmetsp:Transcript_24957/g.18847  ORF Transcript_24957/g.18847 Transcript_24957/m.18847 type:complete len:105 (+) Transcript_24957:87-401(+)
MLPVISRALTNWKQLTTFGVLTFQASQFSKYISKSRTKRLPLTTKRAGKGYYKGNRCRKEGTINSLGRFSRSPDLCTELVVPDFSNFSLKPYVSVQARRNKIGL